MEERVEYHSDHRNGNTPHRHMHKEYRGISFCHGLIKLEDERVEDHSGHRNSNTPCRHMHKE